ncbi:hypothetical protein EDI_093860 [Entamoeba dispar SAW760]|uniref:Mitochondrial carrier protein n=1 Tax=Entamoeba dispar (strain ATCC PRA-260 / SAW760) TaxID=370354 RepID=B0EDH8_ENTDS|nr:uncharacterized protein EDI_093860 [Entamoeba dispar SAW760]EDR27595.1 hypothetical protein EDI_093860 [Entamoeba dispar SAW760]|eukprot:EDR27595.1 hypothetical protein EDI_093860 [Entamoeba dispar SAW760]
MEFKDPYKLVQQIFTPLSYYIPESFKAEKKNARYGFFYGIFQTTIESAFFGQVINYSFLTHEAHKKYNWNPTIVYKTFPKNLNNLIPYYSTTRALQCGYPKTQKRNWMIRILTPVIVLPYEHVLSFFTHKLIPSIPRPICSVYQNIIPFTMMELILETSSSIKPTVQKTLNCILSNGWAQLGTAAIGNAFGYLMNHPAFIINTFMKQHPEMGFIQSVKYISTTKGIKGFYTGSIHRCTRAAHSAAVTSLAGVAFDTLFLKKNNSKTVSKRMKLFWLF